MGWSRIRLGFLSLVGMCAVAACDSIDDEELPVWTPIDEVQGMFRPELSQPPNAPTSSVRVRVVSYNVLRGVDLDVDAAFFLSDPDLAAADVIALQEATRRVDAPDSDAPDSDAAELARRLEMGHVFVPTFEEDGRLHGIALLSRLPLTDIQVMRLPEARVLDLRLGASRAALKATLLTAEGPIDIINVHLDVPINVPERILQLRPAVLDARAPVAVLGDYNTNDYVWAAETVPILPLDAVASTSQADALDGYMRAIGYATPTAGFGNTWHGLVEDQRLDAVFTRGLVPGQGAVERGLDSSDHWPIWLDVHIDPHQR